MKQSSSYNPTYHPQVGETIKEVAEKMVALATPRRGRSGRAITAVLDDIALQVQPGENASVVIEQHRRTMERRLELEKLLEGAPEVEIVDLKQWNDFKASQWDFFGRRSVRLATGWARLMQVEMAKGRGRRLASCAIRCAQAANTDQFVLLEFREAVKILAAHWTHGHLLLEWYMAKVRRMPEYKSLTPEARQAIRKSMKPM